MKKMTEKEYYKIHKDYRGVWRDDRAPELIGKRTYITMVNGITTLQIEGRHFVIVKDEK